MASKEFYENWFKKYYEYNTEHLEYWEIEPYKDVQFRKNLNSWLDYCTRHNQDPKVQNINISQKIIKTKFIEPNKNLCYDEGGSEYDFE